MTWKIQLATTMNFIFSKDDDEERVMHSKSDNMEIMINDEANEVIKELFDSFKNRYQNNLVMYYKCHKINLIHGGSYVDSIEWIKDEKATINPINKKVVKCFQYAVTVALNYEEIGKHAKRITKNKPFINKYKREGINFSSEKYDLKKT